MTARGALKALEAGAWGIVISNHAGNTMDQSMATVEVLQEIKEAVGDKLKLIIDGGIRMVKMSIRCWLWVRMHV